MDPLSVIKAKRHKGDSSKKVCYICKGSKSQNTFSAAKEDGKERVWCVAGERRELGDTQFTEVLHHTSLITKDDFCALDITWHKNCYATFTSREKIERLRDKKDKSESSTSHSECDKPSLPSRRSFQSAINWALCMFCQEKKKAKLHSVETLEKSAEIILNAQSDPTMRIRLSGVSDLIAAEGCYHLKCLVKSQREASKKHQQDEKQGMHDDPCMELLCGELHKGLSDGHVYDANDVWNRYKHICSSLDIDIPRRYESRRATFCEDIQRSIADKASFVRPLSKGPLIIYPGEQTDNIISQGLSKSGVVEAVSSESDSMGEEETDVLEFSPHSSIWQEMVHVALMVRQDLLETPGHPNTWQGIDREHVNDVIPDSLYLFLRLLFRGMDLVNQQIEDEEKLQQTVCSIAQDIVYAVSGKRKLTPKHIGLGLALHQATRSEVLVELFHSANHTIGIDTVRRIDTSIAQSVLDQYTTNGYVYVPENLTPGGELIHCSCDNIDVLEANLDGKNTFHCTQMVVWQRGPEVERKDLQHKTIQRPRAISSDALQNFQKLEKAHLPSGTRPTPTYGNLRIEEEWFSESKTRDLMRCKDLAWVVSRINDEKRLVPSWSSLNEATSKADPPVTKVGMLPILQAQADDNDTLTTVIKRFMDISHKMGQEFTIITADQPLYSRAKELVWANPKFEKVILLMGGLHICFNFLKAIGQHMESAGLDDLWIAADVYAANTTDTMMNGKAYYRAVRGHMLVYEALWKIKWPMFENWMSSKEKELDIGDLCGAVSSAYSAAVSHERDEISTATDALSEVLGNEQVRGLFDDFECAHSENPNFVLWSSYMKMVEILMDFIRSMRDGNWLLHLEAFSAMLPWLTIYDHTNYARWGPVYLADMKLLEVTAPSVHEEFLAGNFVVKRTNRRFNQVPADQATEWMNKACKMQNGIIGITQNDQARDRFCMTWAERSQITQDAKSLFGLENDDESSTFSRTDSLPSRTRRDVEDVEKLTKCLQTFDVFRIKSQIDESDPDRCVPLVNLATKDKAPPDVQNDLLTAETRGKEALKKNVRERLNERKVKFFEPITKHRSKTFADLYKMKVSRKQEAQKTIKADRNLLQRLLNAVRAGRKVDMANVLTHELTPFPLSLASLGGEMNSTKKNEMLNLLTADIEVPFQVPTSNTPKKTCILIDGHALIQALGKPSGCQSFGDYGKVFFTNVSRYLGNDTTRVDVVFDRYIGSASIKTVTRTKRIGKKKPIRTLIDGPDVPLPVWDKFIPMDDNKADLANFLSNVIIERGKSLPEEFEIVTGGGFVKPTDAKSTRGDATELQGNHEEADTRLVLHLSHAAERGYDCFHVVCKDTDVLILLIHHLPVGCEVWMISGTSKARKCYPVHVISDRLSCNVKENLPGFHALTGCDTLSSFSGYGKKTCWKVFLEYPHLLNGIGRDGNFENIESFVCKLYGATSDESSIDHVRLLQFEKSKTGFEMLPPTKDALQLHSLRADYQARIWLQAKEKTIDIERPESTSAWELKDGTLQIKWTQLPPIPSACLELITCGCKTKCKNARCSCFKNNLKCTAACGCDAIGCFNPAEN